MKLPNETGIQKSSEKSNNLEVFEWMGQRKKQLFNHQKAALQTKLYQKRFEYIFQLFGIRENPPFSLLSMYH